MAEHESPDPREPFQRQKDAYAGLAGAERQQYTEPLRADLREALVDQDQDEAAQMDQDRGVTKEYRLQDERTAALDALDPATRKRVLQERQQFEAISENGLLTDERKEEIIGRMVERKQAEAMELHEQATAAEEAKAMEEARDTIKQAERLGAGYTSSEKRALVENAAVGVAPTAEALDRAAEQADAKIGARVGRGAGRMQEGFGQMSQAIDRPLSDHFRRARQRTKEVAGMPNGRISRFTAGLVRGSIELVGLAGLVLAKGFKGLRRRFGQR